MIYSQIDAYEFEGLLYNILSEEPFNNQIINRTEEKYDYTISDDVSQHLVILIGETMICPSCHQNRRPRLLKDESFILLVG